MTTASYRRFSGTGAENYQRYFVPAIATPVSVELLRSAALTAWRPRARRRLRHRRHRPPRGGTGRTDWFGDGHRRRARHDRRSEVDRRCRQVPTSTGT